MILTHVIRIGIGQAGMCIEKYRVSEREIERERERKREKERERDKEKEVYK